jgi:predicted transcriptional regulator
MFRALVSHNTMEGGKRRVEEVNFLADSVYRSAILARLHEGPCTRAELRTDTGVSSATLSRVLRAFEDRDWIARSEQRYELTPPGVLVAVGFDDLLRLMEIERKLRGVWRGIPAALLELDVEWVVETAVTLPNRHNPLAPMDRAADIDYAAARSRLLTHALPDPCLGAHRRGITTGSHRLEAVVTRDVARTLAGTPHAPWIEDVLATDRLDVFVTDAEVPHVIGINDDTVYFGVDDEKGAPLALIETGDETVRVWAEWTFESHRREAFPLAPDEFSRLREAAKSDDRVPSGAEPLIDR